MKTRKTNRLVSMLLFVTLLSAVFSTLAAEPDKIKLQKTKGTQNAKAAAEPAHHTSGDKIAQEIEVGVIVGYNPNVKFDRNGQAYQSGEDAFGVPIWSFGLRGKMDFGAFGVRGAATYSFSPERSNSRSTTATPGATPYVESGNGVVNRNVDQFLIGANLRL